MPEDRGYEGMEGESKGDRWAKPGRVRQRSSEHDDYSTTEARAAELEGSADKDAEHFGQEGSPART